MIRLFLLLLTLSVAAPASGWAAHHEDAYDPDEYLVSLHDIQQIGACPTGVGCWYSLRFDVLTLPTDEGRCRQMFTFPLDAVPGGLDSKPGYYAAPVKGSPDVHYSVSEMNFHPVAYGQYPRADFSLMLALDPGDCDPARPIQFRVKARARSQR